jgi:3-oxoacyl-[acyl-carrier protein] reductase
MKNRIALVTGSTRGIGFGIASKLATEFASVGINGRSIEDTNRLVDENTKFFDARADLNNIKSIELLSERIAAKFGNLDLLVCNVGGGRPVLDSSDIDEWKRVFELNFFSQVNTINYLGPLVRKGTGKIIFISSIATNPRVDAPIPYAVSKSALNSFAEQIAIKYASQGISVNTLVLGNILFEGSVWQEKIQKNELETLKYISSRVPLNDFGSIDEIAEWVSFIASDKVRFTTGSLIHIDGGQSL